MKKSLQFIHSVTVLSAHLYPEKWICMVLHRFTSIQISSSHEGKKEAQIPVWLVIVSSLCFRTVVKCNIAKSQALYSAQRGLKTNNAAVFKVGAIVINIPQHPATLHSMMVRSSHQLSKQISDLIRQPSTTYVCSCFPSNSYRIKLTLACNVLFLKPLIELSCTC